jgi:hypothetical protein
VARKRKKPEDRVAELELKLEKLTSQLHGSSSEPSPQMSGSFSYPEAKVKLSNSHQLDQLFGSNTLHEISNAITASNEVRMGLLKRNYVDVINEGIITLDEAKLRYQLYTTVLYNRYPFVKIVVEFEKLRTEYPTLFITLMAITGSIRDDAPSVETNIQLENLAQQQLMDEILLQGNKTVELLKSLLVWTIWYNTPEMFHQRRYHIFSALCVSMCFDLGLTGRPYYVVDKNDGSFQRTRVLEEPQKEEYRCLVLTVYCLTTSYSIFLRRRLSVPWSSYMEECVQVLKMSQDSRHRTVAVFAKLTSMMEQVENLVDTKDDVNYHLVKHLVSGITELKEEETNIEEDILKAFASSIEASLYSKFTTVDMSLKCLHACIDCIKRFSVLTSEQLASTPLMIFGRLMYCFALFLKTINFLEIDVDLEMAKKLLFKLEQCSNMYKNVHVVLKVRLLLYFYLTTFVKNKDFFNKVNEESAMDSMSKTMPHPVFGSVVDAEDKLMPQPNPAMPIPSNTHDPSAISLPHSSSGAVNTPHNLGPVPMSIPNMGQPMNTALAPPIPAYIGSTVGDTVRLDILSDATMKGFDPNEGIPTDQEFWRIFDKVDDQFYL